MSQPTRIDENAFAECEDLEEVNAPKVTHVGEAAFFRCENLERVDMPKLAHPTLPRERRLAIGHEHWPPLFEQPPDGRRPQFISFHSGQSFFCHNDTLFMPSYSTLKSRNVYTIF